MRGGEAWPSLAVLSAGPAAGSGLWLGGSFAGLPVLLRKQTFSFQQSGAEHKQTEIQTSQCVQRKDTRLSLGINNLSAHPEEYTLQGETCYNSDFCKHPNNEMKYNCPLRGKKYLSIVSSGCQIKISVFVAPIWRFYLYNMIQYRPGECITHRTNMKAKK